MKNNSTQGKRVRFLTNTAYWAVIIALVYFIFKYFLNLIMPFFIGLIIAALARPLARFITRSEKKGRDADGQEIMIPRVVKMSYNVAAIISVIVVYIAVIALIAVFTIPVINFIAGWISKIPGIYNDTLRPALENLLDSLDDISVYFNEPVASAIENAIPNLISSLGSFITNASGTVLAWISSLATSLPSVMIKILIAMVASVFIAVDYDLIGKFITINLKSNVLRVVLDIRDSMVSNIWLFIRSYAVIFVITAVEISIGLMILGKDNAVLYGILIAVFDAFPVVGSGTILVPWSIITMITTGFWSGAGLLILYFIVVIVRQIIEPRIVGHQVGLRPIVTLFCMYVGTRLFSVLGLFGLPIMAAIISELNRDGKIHLFTGVDEYGEAVPEETDAGEDDTKDNDGRQGSRGVIPPSVKEVQSDRGRTGKGASSSAAGGSGTKKQFMSRRARQRSGPQK